MDVLTIALQAAFFGVFAVVLVQYVRDPTPVRRDVTLVFAGVAALFAVNLLGQIVPSAPPAIRSLAVLALLAQPWLTFRLTRTVAHPTGRAEAIIGFWFVTAFLVYLAAPPRTPQMLVYVVGYFVVVEALAAAQLARAARGRLGLARTRLGLMSGATVAFAGCILVASVGGGTSTPSSTTQEVALVISRSLALLAGLAYLAAFAPPEGLRRLQQRAAAFDLSREFMNVPGATDLDSIWSGLASAARRVMGSGVALVSIGDRAEIRAVAGNARATVAVGQSLLPGPHETASETNPDAAAIREVLTEALGEPGATAAVPISSDSTDRGWLVAAADRPSLFVEDDRWLLELLAREAATAAERHEAIRERGELATELEVSAQELAVSRAELDSEARFRVALEAHPSPLLVLGDGGAIDYANERAAAAFGYSDGDLIGLPLGRLLPGVPDLRAVHRGEIVALDASRRDGSTFPADLAMSPFRWNDRDFTIAVITDISSRLETERLRDTFIGILSHELRTPVTSIYGGSQVLLARRELLDPAVVHELIEDIAAEAERLNRLIENLLVLARIERGHYVDGGEPVLLQRVLPALIERERALWPGTEITASVPSGVPTIRAHDGYVAQVIRNLISNAAKYSGASGRIDVVVDTLDAAVRVRVLDEGPGIGQDDADQLFELYYRAPAAALTAPGAGIGLYVCRQIIVGLGGRIWAKPRPDGGSEFGFELPVYEADETTDWPAQPSETRDATVDRQTTTATSV
ncbi:MAG: ATP-binding protein [Chloroflexota bacterium]